MKSKCKKQNPDSVLGIFNLGELCTVKTGDDGTFRPDEADVTIVLEAALSGQSVICILSDDTDVSVLLVYWGRHAVPCTDGALGTWHLCHLG